MKQFRLIAYAALGIFLSSTVWAAEQRTMQPSSGQTETETQMKTTQEQNPLMAMQVKQLTGKTVVNAQGQKLGEVTKIVQSHADESIDAVVSVGGFLGFGTTKITIPLDQLQLREDKLALNKSTSVDQLKQQPEFQQAQYRDLDDNKILADVAAGEAAAAKKQVSFQRLDKDHNGYISPQEAQIDPQLSSKFSQADKNTDNQIDQSEFSAFEQTNPQSMPAEHQNQPQAPQSQ